MTERGEHIQELDWLKGVAILCVICIHGELLKGTFLFREFIDRAVMIFMVLFGTSSELWFKRQSPDGVHVLSAWYVQRLSRILLGCWLLFAAWWMLRTTWTETGSTNWFLPTSSEKSCILRLGLS